MGVRRRTIREREKPEAPYVEHPELAGEKVCEQLLEKLAPAPEAPKRRWTRPYPRVPLSFD
jgi:hypothetical protein